jgi:Fe-coproporphyrin III synthase
MKPHHYPLRVLQNRLGLVPKPSYVTYLVCDRCNARCGMCDSWRMPRGVELTAEQVSQVFGKLGSLDAVRLSGGEPFLRADLLELAEAVMAASAPGLLHITTNGSFPDRIAPSRASFRARAGCISWSASTGCARRTTRAGDAR